MFQDIKYIPGGFCSKQTLQGTNSEPENFGGFFSGPIRRYIRKGKKKEKAPKAPKVFGRTNFTPEKFAGNSQ